MRYHFLPLKMAVINEAVSVPEDVGKLDHPTLLGGGMQNGAATVEKSLVIPQKAKHGITTWPSKVTLGYMHSSTENRDSNRDLYTNVHCSIVHNGQEGETTKMSTTNEWISKAWHVCIRKYHPTVQRNRVLVYVITWMNTEDIRLRKMSKAQKTRYIQFIFCETSRTQVKFTKTKEKGWGVSRMESIASWL